MNEHLPAVSTSFGERKVATVLFADLAGSTAWAAGEDPERVRSMLERFYQAMAAEVAAADGTTEKFIGDAIVAAFGVPVAHEDHAERALHVALAMHQRMNELFGDSLALRIGVNTGDVFVGASRPDSSFVSGDTVNVAARLEHGAGAGETLVGERTALATRSAFEFSSSQVLEAKGKAQGILCRKLLRSLALVRPRGIGGLPKVFVGRETELAAMREAYERACERRTAETVVIVGDAGVGKTRLLSEFLDGIMLDACVPLRLEGHCLAYGRGITYWPLGEILRSHFGILESDSHIDVLHKLGSHRTLAWTVGVDMPEGLHPLAARDRLHGAWVAFVEELAAKQTVVLLVEDVHWAEDPLLELIDAIASQVRGPLLLVATGRPELLDRNWMSRSTRSAVTVVDVEPLSDSNAAHMVDALLPAAAARDVRDMVVARAEGNPFYVEELIASLADQGNPTELPDSVRAVIASRIDRLDPVDKAALQAASVVGRNFWNELVYELVDGGSPDFRLLETRDFIRPVARASLANQREYMFKHALTREVAYESLAKGRRAQLHAAVADWIERGSLEGEEHAALLAHHYVEAVRGDASDLAWANDPERLAQLRERAVFWLQRAGQLAMRRYAIDDAISLLTQALQLEPPTETQADLWRLIATAHALRYEGAATVAAYQTATSLTKIAAKQGAIFAELAFETVMRYGMLNPMPPREHVETWIAQALELAHDDPPARARALIARAFWYASSPDAAAEAVAVSESISDVALRSQAYNAEVVNHFVHDGYDESYEWAQRRLALADQISDPDHLVDIYSMVIPGLLGRGRFAEARQYAELHDEAASKLSTHHQVHAVAMKIELEELAGNWEAIVELEPRTERTVEANGNTPCVRNARSLLACALAAAHQGDAELSRRLEAQAGELDMQGFAAMLAPLRIWLALAEGRLEQVEQFLEQAVPPPPAKNWWRLTTLAARLDALSALGCHERVEEEAPPHLVAATYLEPFAMRALGRSRKDADMINAAVASFQRMGMDWHARQTRTAMC